MLKEVTPMYHRRNIFLLNLFRIMAFAVAFLHDSRAQAYSTSHLTNPPQARLRKLPAGFEGEFIAFSLSEAEKKVSPIYKRKDYRNVYQDIYQLGGIRQIYGLVYDPASEEIILVGRAKPQRPPLTIDDLVVALRARFTHGEWPLVSIDLPEGNSTNRKQRVRFGGGIENTQFGMDLFDADYRLKLIGLGHLKSGVSGMPTYWDLWLNNTKDQTYDDFSDAVRFWFYPVLSNVTIRNGVAAIGKLRVKIFSEHHNSDRLDKKYARQTQNVAANEFSVQVNNHFEEIGKRHLSIARLTGLEELVALTMALDKIDVNSDLSFWLEEYEVKRVKIPATVEIVSRKDFTHEMSGGVRLMALALRLKGGDISALKDAVLNTRPSPDSIHWTFSIGEWVIPTSPGMVRHEDLNSLFVQAHYFQELGYEFEAISLFDKIISLAPDSVDAYRVRAISLRKMGKHSESEADLEKVRFLESIYSRNSTISPVTRRLVLAAHEGDIETVRGLIAKGANINERNGTAYTALAAASQSGHTEIVRALLDHGANPDLANYAGSTPLMLAADGGHISVVRYLLDKQADVSAETHEGNTALEVASLMGEPKTVQLLLANGASVNIKDSRGITPLIAASSRGHTSISQLLIQSGADLTAEDNEGNSALIIAVRYEHVALVKILLTEGADANAGNASSWTALLFATLKDNTELVNLLIDNGVDVNAKEGLVGTTPLELASQVAAQYVAKVLIERGADVNSKNTRNASPLHLAVVEGHDSMVDMLLASDADVDAIADGGVSALFAASQLGHDGIVQALLGKGANVTCRTDKGGTALSVASQMGYYNIVKALLDNGADVNIKKSNGLTPLHAAAFMGHKAVVELLIAKGANVNAKDKIGATPLAYAAKQEHVEIIELLRMHSAD